MEGQAVPRLQPITIHHINKGRHHAPNVTSPPLSPTSATPPVQHMETPKVKPLNKMTTPNPKSSQNGAESQKRGWLSFDDSPVHAQPANSNFPAGQSPWAAAAEKQWTPFSEGASKQDTARTTQKTAAQQQRLPAQEIPSHVPQANPRGAPPVTNTPIKPVQSVPSYHSTPTVNPSNSQHASVAKPALSESSIVTNQGTIPTYQTPDAGSRRRNASKEEDGIHMEPHDGNNDFQDPWCITSEQRDYYTKQFATMQSDLEGKINGQSARSFFTKSKLPILELSHIWELSDMDQDGHLTLDEFCTAFHLVVARKNGYDLPPQLPQALVPTLIDISGDIEKNVQDPNTTDGKNQQSLNHSITSPKRTDPKQEQWETFSDRTSSSTTLANFDQVLDSTTENLHHPVAVRMTPSRHHEHWTRVGEMDGETPGTQSKTETLDEESTTSSPQTRSKVMTNPYGYLQNEPDSAGEDREIKQTTVSSSSDSTTNALETSEKPYMRHKVKGRSHSNSSISSTTSSVATSERSSGDDDFHNNGVRSDPEHSDWSSRPLRPRSGSSSSMESGSVPPVTAPPPPVAAAPTPPPRPQVHPQTQHTASPIPKPRPVAAKTNSTDKSKSKQQLKDREAPRVDGPTPPPRPQQTANESFADFSSFNQPNQTEEPPTSNAPAKPSEDKHQQEKVKPETVALKDHVEKPVPAPRPQKEALKSNETSENESKEVEAEKSLPNKKAPVKPPRTRMLSADVCKPEPILTSLTVKSNDEAKIDAAPKQEANRQKMELQSAIRELKNRNTQLTRLNGDLQQQLKDVMEKRITVEMTIHQMRPFTQ